MNIFSSTFDNRRPDASQLRGFHYFLLRVALFLLMVATPVTFLHLVMPPWPLDPQNMLAAMIDKHAAVAASPARLLIVGGSSAAFGVDSERISRELSVPVVNLGLHAGLGLDFMLQEVAAVATRDDLVILCPEAMLSREGEYKLKRLAQSLYPASGAYFTRDLNLDAAISIERFKDRLELFRQIWLQPSTGNGATKQSIAGRDARPQMSENALHAWTYTRSAFTPFGDHVAHTDEQNRRPLSRELLAAYRRWDGIAAMNEFSMGFCGDVFFYHAPLLEDSVAEDLSFPAMYQASLDRDLRIRQLNTFSDSLFPLDSFFDSCLHLNGAARQEHTRRLIAAIRQEPAVAPALRRIQKINAMPRR
jgi:hypothetical protein